MNNGFVNTHNRNLEHFDYTLYLLLLIPTLNYVKLAVANTCNSYLAHRSGKWGLTIVEVITTLVVFKEITPLINHPKT